jgi:hypothetical protein
MQEVSGSIPLTSTNQARFKRTFNSLFVSVPFV